MSTQSPTEDHLRDGPAREVEDSKDNIQPLGEKVTRHRRRPRIPALSLAAALLSSSVLQSHSLAIALLP